MLELEDNLSKIYETTLNLNPTAFLGMNIERDRKKKTALISMPGYTQRIIEEYEENKNSKIASTPSIILSENSKNQEDSSENQLLNKELHKRFMKIVGSLLYLAISTRPDILASVNRLTQRLTRPTIIDYAKTQRILHYLKGTINLGLNLQGGSDISIYAYADASYASNSDRKSQHGLCYKLGKNNSIFYFNSKKQSIVSLSSTEAEYISATEATRDILFFRSFLNILGFDQTQPTVLYQDNKSTIKLTENKNFHERTKHIDIRYHFIRDEIIKKNIILEYLPTSQMLADVLSKEVCKSTLDKIRNAMIHDI